LLSAFCSTLIWRTILPSVLVASWTDASPRSPH